MSLIQSPPYSRLPTKEMIEKMKWNTSNFEGLVLGCMDSYDSNQILILQHFSRSTRFSYFCTAQISKFQQKIVKIFGGMKKIHFISFAFFDGFCDFSAKIWWIFAHLCPNCVPNFAEVCPTLVRIFVRPRKPKNLKREWNEMNFFHSAKNFDDFCWNFEILAVQRNANLVDIEKSEKCAYSQNAKWLFNCYRGCRCSRERAL